MAEDNQANYYAILGVSEDAEDIAIKRAYRKLAKELHPDVNPDNPEAETQFKEVAVAYKILDDPILRSEYDRYRKASEAPPEAEFQNIDPDYFSSVFGREEDWDSREAEVLHNFYEYLKNRAEQEDKKGKSGVWPQKSRKAKKEAKKKEEKPPPFHDHPLRKEVIGVLKNRIIGPKVYFLIFVLVIAVLLIFGWFWENKRLIKKLQEMEKPAKTSMWVNTMTGSNPG